MTKVAQRMGVTQPTASRMLRELEEHVQVALVVRSPQGARLTREGLTLATRSASVVAEVDDLLPPSHAASAQGPVICSAWNGLEGALSAALAAWHAESPGSPCRMKQSEDPAGDVLSHRADLALVRGGDVTDDGLTSCRLDEEERLAVVPAHSPLAEKMALTLGDLADFEVVVNITSGTTQDLVWPEQAKPYREIEVEGFEEWVMTIAASPQRFGLTPDSTERHYVNSRLRFVRVLDAPTVPVHLLWRRGDSRPGVNRFIHLVRSSA